MAVVRCVIHNIPYNDENPRGCPACAREEAEDDGARVMRELARASRGGPAVEVLPSEGEDDDVSAVREWGPVTTPPRLPTAEPTQLENALAFLSRNRLGLAGFVLVIVAIVLGWLATRPTFTPAFQPPLVLDAGPARPFPIEPNTEMVAVFAMLGTVPPQVNPDSQSLARYDFGGGALVDALNAVVYAITLVTPERTWHGHRVGLSEQPARGMVALLGTVLDREPPAVSPFPFGGFLAFSDLAAIPKRRLSAEVRPPNGCYDIHVEVAPQIIGTAARGNQAFVAVARRGELMAWVVHRVRVVSRALEGPYGGAVVC